MTSSAPGLVVDARLLKFSQGSVMALTALAFVLQFTPLAILAAICLGISAIAPQISPFRLLYRLVLVPLHIFTPKRVEDDPAPHRFAQAIGTVFMVASVVALSAHASVAGWALDLIVFVLSGINFTVGFCAGCFVYYHLGRLGLMPRVRYVGDFHWRGV